MTLLSEAALDALAERGDEVTVLESRVAELIAENDSLKQQLEVAKDIRALIVPNATTDGRETRITVTERDANERIQSVVIQNG